MIVLLLTLQAHAQDYIEDWSYTDFPHEQSVAGHDGWVSGYEDNPWYGYTDEDFSRVYSTTDEGSGEFGSGDSVDGWLVYQDRAWEDGLLVVPFYTEDNDGLGIIFRFQDALNYYLLLQSNDSTPVGDGGTLLIRLEDGVPQILDSVDASYSEDTWQVLGLQVNDNAVHAFFWEAWGD